MLSKALKGTLAGAAGMALGLSGVAAAQAQDEDPVAPAATGSIHSEDGLVLNSDTGNGGITASMLSVDLGDGEKRTVYCVQIEVGLKSDLPYQETPWGDTDVVDKEALPDVLGVLLSGYNGGNADAVLDAAGVTDHEFEGASADQVAYAGTQAAVWSLTDDWGIDDDDATGENDEVDKAVTDVMNHLLATEPVDEPEFEPSFEVDDSAAVTDGSKVGPFTVSTNFDSVDFAQPEGATIVDENGEAVTSFTDGLTFYVEFEDAAAGTVTVPTESIIWTTPAGRTFVPVEGDQIVEGQNLILAEEHPSEYAAELEFEIVVEDVPSESPQPQLPVTGASLTTVASVGGAVLVAGVVAIVLMRRRARANWGSEA